MHHHRGLGSWLTTRRAKSPAKTALISGNLRVSYRALADEADRVADLLSTRGIGAGQSVAFLGENSPDFIATFFACADLGAVFVPVNTRLAIPEMTHVLRDSQARVLFHDPEFSDSVAQLIPATELAYSFRTDERSAVTGAAGRAVARPPLEGSRSLDDPAAIIYTSGTTGRAKGAVLSHGNLTWQAVNCLVDFDVVSTDVALMISPLFHVASLGMGVLPVLLKGGTIVLERGFDAGRALELIAQHGVTMLSGVPTTYQLMADHPDWVSTDLTSLTKLTCGGSGVPTRVLNAYEQRGLSFSQGYGLTETSPGATVLDPASTRSKQGSVGLPHFFTDARVVDELGQATLPHAIGEIQIAGPNVFLGYHGLSDATAATFTDDGWFRSGDLGYLDADGYLFIADRLKDMIISGGENIYPAEIENLISDIDGVTAVAVVGVPDDRWGEVPWAIITVRDGHAIDIDTDVVRSFLRDRIARYKIPKNVVVVRDMPRTASGKIRKADLAATIQARAEDRAPS
jgi:fatty-acyl-CoA synthase